MECDGVQERISAFLDLSLGVAEQESMFSHLSTCGECRGFLASALRVRETAGRENVVVPDALDRRILSLAKSGGIHRPAKVGRIGWWQRRLTVSSPVAFAVLFVVLLLAGATSLALFRVGPWGQPAVRPQLQAGTRPVVIVYQLPVEEVLARPPARP